MPRTILIHLNFELPNDSPLTTTDLCEYVALSLDVPPTGPHADAIRAADWCIHLAEEV